MKLELNEKNEIISYLKCGGVDGINFTEFDGVVPDDFEIKFKPYFFMLENGEITENPNYVAPSNDVPTGPTNLQQIIMQQAKTIVQMQSVMMQQSKDIAELKGAKA